MFDQKTIQHLGSYVYLLIDPENNQPFYVGKGTGNRVFDHVKCSLDNHLNSHKYEKIRAITSKGLKVKHVIVRHGLSEKVALEIESSLIDTFSFIPSFAHYVAGNIQGGIQSIEKGLMTTDEIKRLYHAEKLEQINKDCIIININKTYSRGSGENPIYQATKETWTINKKRLNDLKFVLSEYRGLIVEVFEVTNWYAKERGYGKNSKKFGQTRIGYGFNGKIAEDSIRNLYINKSIAHIKKQGSASSFKYSL